MFHGKKIVVVMPAYNAAHYMPLVLPPLLNMLHDGEIAESGTHEALLAAGGHYAQLWSAQQKQRETEQGD